MRHTSRGQNGPQHFGLPRFRNTIDAVVESRIAESRIVDSRAGTPIDP